MHNGTSVFPTDIDSQTFFADMRIKDTQLQTEYLAKVKSGNLDEAAEILDESNLEYYGAYWYNMMVSRLFALETYLSNKEATDRVCYQNEPPVGKRIWIGI